MLYCAELLSSVRFFAMSWTVACQDPLSMGKVQEWVAMPSSRGSSQPRDWTRSPALQADSLPAEPQEKSKNTGVGSLSLLQRLFLTQESNQGLLHCRQILYQLSYERSRKAMTNLDSILKSRDITLPTKVHIVKSTAFLVVMYRCESWTIKKAECRRIDAFKLWCWRRLLRVPWTARRSN